MRNITYLFMAILVGCSTLKPTAKIENENFQESEGKILVLDKRPEFEKASISFSMNPNNCAFAIDRYGDETLIPNRIRLLQHRIFEKFKNSKNLPHELIVYDFVIYNNTQALSRNKGLNAAMNGQGYFLMPDHKITSINDEVYGGSNIPDCEPEEVLRAYYSQDENPNSEAIFVVHLDAEMNGKRVYVRLPLAYENKFGGNGAYQISAVESAISAFLGQY